MEHRHSDRRASDLSILVYKQRLPVAIGIVKNIGCEGVFVESGFDGVVMNQPLEIEFLSGGKAFKYRRFKGVVVHRTTNGFGLEIQDIRAQLKTASASDLGPADKTSMDMPGRSSELIMASTS